MQDVKDMEGYDEMLQKFLDSLPPEQRLAGIPPEQRLAGIPPEQRLAGMSLTEILTAIPEDGLDALHDDDRALLVALLDSRKRRH